MVLDQLAPFENLFPKLDLCLTPSFLLVASCVNRGAKGEAPSNLILALQSQLVCDQDGLIGLLITYLEQTFFSAKC